MSKADEMFKELGYEKDIDNEEYLRYFHKEDVVCIAFDRLLKHIEKYQRNWDKTVGAIYMQELQAINEKVKELGWM